MKICKNCFREFDEQEDFRNPIVELGEIFLGHEVEINPADYCPECRTELGLLNIAGFDN